MNVELIVSMAQSIARDSAITYDEFDKLYCDLTRKEQYEVVNILYENGIDLIDQHVDDEASVLDSEEPGFIDTYIEDEETDDFSHDSFFKDAGSSEDQYYDLAFNKEVHQSNAILCTLIQRGNRQAAQDLCVKNKALVDKYVNAYMKKYGHGLDFEDLEQVGFMGLLKAAEKFNTTLGAFSTYAVYWIKQAISRDIMDNGFIIRIPVHMMERIIKVTETEYKCPNGASFNEKIQFIADDLELEEKEVRECIHLRENVLSHTSLSTLIGEDGDTELGDFLSAEEDDDPVAKAVIDASLRNDLEKMLSCLTPRESKIIKLRIGWDGGKAMTLEQIGQEFHVTRERIRQIEAKAKRKLQNKNNLKYLKVYREG